MEPLRLAYRIRAQVVAKSGNGVCHPVDRVLAAALIQRWPSFCRGNCVMACAGLRALLLMSVGSLARITDGIKAAEAEVFSARRNRPLKPSVRICHTAADAIRKPRLACGRVGGQHVDDAAGHAHQGTGELLCRVSYNLAPASGRLCGWSGGGLFLRRRFRLRFRLLGERLLVLPKDVLRPAHHLVAVCLGLWSPLAAVVASEVGAYGLHRRVAGADSLGVLARGRVNGLLGIERVDANTASGTVQVLHDALGTAILGRLTNGIGVVAGFLLCQRHQDVDGHAMAARRLLEHPHHSLVGRHPPLNGAAGLLGQWLLLRRESNLRRLRYRDRRRCRVPRLQFSGKFAEGRF